MQMLSEKILSNRNDENYEFIESIAELNVIVVITQQMTIHGNKPKAQNVEMIVLNILIVNICASEMTGLFLLIIFSLKVHISVQLKDR
jgi:hypothetical protein